MQVPLRPKSGKGDDVEDLTGVGDSGNSATATQRKTHQNTTAILKVVEAIKT